jgi:hypothetical protein
MLEYIYSHIVPHLAFGLLKISQCLHYNGDLKLFQYIMVHAIVENIH